ncbi:MAG: alpha/beta hydrolase [Pirellulales bacterium]
MINSKFLFSLIVIVLGYSNIYAQSGSITHEGQYFKNLTYQGPITGDEIIYTLYLPPGYSEDKGPYPLAIFLHGAGGGNASAQVLESYEAARKDKQIKDCIIMFPERYGGTAWRDGKNDKRPETNILKELLPYLEDKYALSTDRNHRTIMGFSMGSAGSLFWGTKYSDLFSIVVALDAGGGNSFTDKTARNYIPQYIEKRGALQNGLLHFRIVQGALDTKAFRKSLDEMNVSYEYVQIPKDIEYYKEGCHCLNKRDPTKKMLHNPACLTEDTWGRDTWFFIDKHTNQP